jgi:hypothetical protein
VLSERAQRQVDRLLDAADEAIRRREWREVRACASDVLALDPDNADARAFLAAAERASAAAGTDEPGSEATRAPHPDPSAFCDGRYDVVKFLGEGGKKRVYLAHDTLLDRDVAFALIKTEGLDDVGRERIRREAQAMGRLGAHPHVVSVFDLGETEGQPFIVTELMGGGDVEGLIEKAPDHRIPLAEALRIADEVCRGLEFAHSNQIVHRDLKPGNVWLTADGTAKIGDFGLAVATDRARLTQPGLMVGTVSYMPPEQAMGGEVTPRSDLYSLGAMLYELVTGRPPFIGDESVAIITQHLNTPPIAPSWHLKDLPPGLEALILRLLEKDPIRRPDSATEVRTALEGAGGVASASGSGRRAALGEGESPSAVAGAGENPIYRRIFVGREHELRQLQQAFEAARSGRGSLMMVVGEPGIGKTALCEQLATYAAIRGSKTLVGHCYEEGSLSLPYLAFVEATRSYVLAREPDGLKQDLGSGAAEVARIVSEVRQRLGIEPPSGGGADPDEERWRLFQAVAGFLRNASAVQPIIVVLEDLHWADRGTLDMLIHLARNLQDSRLLLVGTYRDIEVDRTHPLSAALAELRRAATFDRVLLRGLTADEVQRMLGAIAGQTISWGFAEAVHRQTEGNPLFVQEVVRYLAEAGLIQREGGRWERAGQTPLEMSIPEGLRDVIGKRLSRLSPECNRILSVAAVVGRDFDLDMLQSVAGSDAEAVIESLEEAVHVGILEEQARPGAIRYRFTHAFFRQTLYEELSAPRRLRLHQQVGRALQTRYALRLEEHAAELADHFSQSTDPADLMKAVEYGELAARRAMSVYAYGEAARLLEGTLEVQEVLNPDETARRCDLLLALGEALGPAGEPLRAAELVAPDALSLAQVLHDDARAARACELAIDALHRHGGTNVATTQAYMDWAQRLDGYAVPDTRSRAYADCILASGLRARGRAGEANAGVLRALELARRLDEPEVLFRAVASALFPGWPPGFQEEQRRLAAEFAQRPREGVRTSTLVLLLQRAAMHLLAAGDRAGAEQAWAELDRLGGHTHDVVPLLWPLQREAIRAGLDGDLAGAVEFGGQIMTRAADLGIAGAGRTYARWLTFYPLIHLGRPDEALALWQDQRASTADAIAMSAILLAHAGRHREAVEVLEQSNAKAWGVGPDAPAIGHAVTLEAALLLDDRASASVARDDLAGTVALALRDVLVHNVARGLGGAAALLDEPEAARREYERSLAWATAIRYRPEVALTRLQLAELLLERYPAEGVEAQAHLDFVIEEFRAMKMQPALERALRHKGLLHA